MPTAPDRVIPLPSAVSPPTAPPAVIGEVADGGDPSAPSAVVLRGPASLRITGTLAFNGTPVVFPTLVRTPYLSKGKPGYNVTGAWDDEDEVPATESYMSVWSSSRWYLFGLAGVNWTSLENVASPDLVQTWTPQGFASGIPSVTDSSFTAPAAVLAVQSSGANFLETAFAGSDNDLRFTQADGGSPPTIRILMDNLGSNSISVTGRAILIHLRQNIGAFYLTAAQIKTLIETSAPAMALVTVAHKSGNNGTGAVCQPATTDISFGPTALSGGTIVVAPSPVI